MPSIRRSIGKQIEKMAREVSALTGGGPQVIWLDDIEGEAEEERVAREEAEFLSRFGRPMQPHDVVIRWGHYEPENPKDVGPMQ